MCTQKIISIPDFYLWNNLYKCAFKIPVGGKSQNFVLSNLYQIFLDLYNDVLLMSHFDRIIGNFQGFSQNPGNCKAVTGPLLPPFFDGPCSHALDGY